MPLLKKLRKVRNTTTKREYIKKIYAYLYFLAEEPSGKDYPELGLTKEQAKEIEEEIFFV